MVDVWRVNKTQGFKVWIIYVSLKVDIQLVFSGILGDYTVTHKYPLYRAYIGIFHRGSTWDRGTSNYPLTKFLALVFGGFVGHAVDGSETQQSVADMENLPFFLRLS